MNKKNPIAEAKIAEAKINIDDEIYEKDRIEFRKRLRSYLEERMRVTGSNLDWPESYRLRV
jgi:hypothetical protein